MFLDDYDGWIVVFCQTNKPHWLINWLNPFSHCYCYAKSPFHDHYIVVNSSWSNIVITILTTEEMEIYNDALMSDTSEIITYNKINDRKMNYSFFGVFTCVSVTKRLLGIHKRSIITPAQLMRYLQNEL